LFKHEVTAATLFIARDREGGTAKRIPGESTERVNYRQCTTGNFVFSHYSAAVSLKALLKDIRGRVDYQEFCARVRPQLKNI